METRGHMKLSLMKTHILPRLDVRYRYVTIFPVDRLQPRYCIDLFVRSILDLLNNFTCVVKMPTYIYINICYSSVIF